MRNIHRKTPVLESLFNKIADLRPEYCELCKIFHKTYFCRRTPLVAASQRVSTGKQLSLPHVCSYVFVFTLPPNRLAYVINKRPLSLTAKLMGDIVMQIMEN